MTGSPAPGASERKHVTELVVGRDSELERLQECCAQVAAGRSVVVIIKGDAGMGKTRLLHDLRTRLSTWQVSFADGDPGESRLPYGVLTRLTKSLPGLDRLGLDEGSPPGAELDPLIVGAAVLRALGDVPVTAPVALLLDDAGWTDQQSLQALTFALRRLDADPVLAVLTVREEDAHRLPAGLDRLAEAANCKLSLAGLSTDQIIEFAAALGHAPLARREAVRLRAHTGGNPLFLEALLRERASGTLSVRRGPLPAPRSFAAGVGRSLATANPQAVKLIQAAAVLGLRSPLDLAARLAQVDQPLDALEASAPLQLVDAVQRAAGWEITFRHPLIRAAVYDALGPASRSRLHRAAAGLLSPPQALEHRLAAASGSDPALAGTLARQARVDEESGRHGQAADRLLAAADLTPAGPSRDALLAHGVEQLLAAGEVWDARQRWTELMATPPTAGRQMVAAQLAWLQGRGHESAVLAEGVWEDRDAPAATRAAAALLMAQMMVLADQGAEAAEWAERAAGFAELPPPIASFARIHRAVGRSLGGDPEDGLASLGDLPADPAEVPTARLDELWVRGGLRMWCEDVAGAFDDLRERPGDRRGWPLRPYALIRLGGLAQVEYRLGRWDDSLAHADAAAGLVADTEQVWLLAFGHAMPIFVLAARGQWDQAAAHLAEASRAADALGDRASRNYAANAAVHLAACQADPAAIIEAAAPLRFAPGGAQILGILDWQTEYVWALLSTGRYEEAGAVLDRVAAQADRRRLRRVRATAARLRGELNARLRRSDPARDDFESAEQLALGGPPFNRARIQLAHGSFVRRAGERKVAAELLRSARDTFRRLQAQPFLERCLDELAACGLGDDQPSAGVRAAPRLTAQELAVARLVSQGLSNREVAAQLVLSVKTISYHLGNVYSKYGVRSRTQLAARFHTIG